MQIFIIMSIGLSVIVIALLVTIIKNKAEHSDRLFEVFEFTLDGKLIVCAGISVTYEISNISHVEFSIIKRRSNRTGLFRIVSLNGKKSRPFTFDSSSYKKHIVWTNSREDIELATDLLINQLMSRGIYSSRAKL